VIAVIANTLKITPEITSTKSFYSFIGGSEVAGTDEEVSPNSPQLPTNEPGAGMKLVW
jgi:hypothetical protein